MLKKKIIIIVVVIVFLQSCAITGLNSVSKSFEYEKILSDTSKTYIYRASLDLYDNDFSGMIIIKPQEDNFRIVFINEIGMKFFDIEVFEETHKVNHIFEPMNKKMLINLLVSDFRFILMNNLKSDFKIYEEKGSGLIAIKPKGKKEVYFFNNQSKFPEKAVKYSIFRKMVFLTYEDYKEEVPKHISIKHKNIKFSMDLKFLK